MKHLLTLSACLAVAIFASSASADLVVNLSGLDVNSQFNANGGSYNVTNTPLGVASATHSFTVPGLSVDGVMTDVVFSYDVVSTGGLIENITGNAFSYGVDGAADPGDNEIDPGETISFSNLSISATDPRVMLVSSNFTGFNWRFSGGDTGETVDAEFVGGTETAPGSGLWTNTGGANARANFVSPQSAFTITGATTGNGFGIDSISATFQLNAVPEPSSFALIGLVGFACTFRRRRN
jgi:hypothetical protein